MGFYLSADAHQYDKGKVMLPNGQYVVRSIKPPNDWYVVIRENGGGRCTTLVEEVSERKAMAWVEWVNGRDVK
jgi:hypothetical protein